MVQGVSNTGEQCCGVRAMVMPACAQQGRGFGGDSTDRWGPLVSDRKGKTITGCFSCGGVPDGTVALGRHGGEHPKEFF
jgi:hypothetical protein